jgi:looped-hinge helix DNA binding domain, AbrB family
METTATTKGQIVIPSKIRRMLGITAGTRLHIEVDEKLGEIILKPITREYIQSQRGRLRGKHLLKALMEEKEKEKRF